MFIEDLLLGRGCCNVNKMWFMTILGMSDAIKTMYTYLFHTCMDILCCIQLPTILSLSFWRKLLQPEVLHVVLNAIFHIHWQGNGGRNSPMDCFPTSIFVYDSQHHHQGSHLHHNLHCSLSLSTLVHHQFCKINCKIIWRAWQSATPFKFFKTLLENVLIVIKL